MFLAVKNFTNKLEVGFMKTAAFYIISLIIFLLEFVANKKKKFVKI